MSVYQKILQAQKAIGYVPKNGVNKFQNYEYATEADILDTVKQAANEAGLIIITSATSEIGQFDSTGGKGEQYVCRWAKVTLNYKVIDAETGDKVEGTFDGYAEDKGDKAIYKATTGANKYFLMKFFGVATGDDPERDEENPGSKGRKSPPPASGPVDAPQNNSQSTISLKRQIRELVGKHNISWPQVTTITGIPSVLQSENVNDLLSVLDKLKIHVKEVKGA